MKELDRIPITDKWLGEVGFKWRQEDRQPTKHWSLMLSFAIQGSVIGDLAIELASRMPTDESKWFCWLKSNNERSKFLHIRGLEFRDEVISLIESCTGQKWNPENNLYGNMYRPDMAQRLREDYEKSLAKHAAFVERADT